MDPATSSSFQEYIGQMLVASPVPHGDRGAGERGDLPALGCGQR